jgi:hypothetical protein
MGLLTCFPVFAFFVAISAGRIPPRTANVLSAVYDCAMFISSRQSKSPPGVRIRTGEVALPPLSVLQHRNMIDSQMSRLLDRIGRCAVHRADVPA